MPPKPLIFLVAIILLSMNNVSNAQSIKLDKSFSIQGLGTARTVSGELVPQIIFFTKFIEFDGKVAVCAGYEGKINHASRFLKAGKVKHQRKNIVKNLRFIRNVSLRVRALNRAKTGDYRKKYGTDYFRKALIDERRVQPTVWGLQVPCKVSKHKWTPAFEKAAPQVKMPSTLERPCPPGLLCS